MLNSISVTAPTLNDDNTVNAVIIIIGFMAIISAITWFVHKIWGS